MSSDKWCTRDFFVEDEESQYSFSLVRSDSL